MGSDAEGGFTLLELLVVVIIIGILAAIAVPTFLSQRERGYDAQMVSDLRNAAMRMEQHYAMNGEEYEAVALDGFRSTQGVVTAEWIAAGGQNYCLTSSVTGMVSRVFDQRVGGIQPAGAAC